MPCLELSTNVRIPDQHRLMRALSSCVCQVLGKAETYMMVLVHDEVPMLFSGNTDPTAYMNLRVLGLKPDTIKSLAQALTTMIQTELEIESQRIYIVFMDAEMNKWAWDGRTFA